MAQFGFLTEAPRACVSIGIANAGPLNDWNPITDKQSLTDTYVGGPPRRGRWFPARKRHWHRLRAAHGFHRRWLDRHRDADAQAGKRRGPVDFGHSERLVPAHHRRITAAGLVAGPLTPSARISWDGGANFDPEFSIPIGGVYTPTTAPSGLTFNFTNGAGGFQTGDLFTFSATGRPGTVPAW